MIINSSSAYKIFDEDDQELSSKLQSSLKKLSKGQSLICSYEKLGISSKFRSRLATPSLEHDGEEIADLIKGMNAISQLGKEGE